VPEFALPLLSEISTTGVPNSPTAAIEEGGWMQGNMHGRCMTWKSLLPYHSFLRCAFQAAIGECVEARGHRAANPIAMPGWRVLYADRWP
jgi:hypothetical protein